ncbi:MAG TPA: hypothetical protein VHP33_21695 [Polyangiaceae bacterium]|nr:hypothetical protein [Polyangiaceae bacterium]
MAHSHAPLACLVLLPAAAFAWTFEAKAALPADYTGTPYMGTAQAIPGRVDLAKLDEGGLNVAFFADHRRDNAVAEGYSPISGDDFRVGNLNLPNICKTNKKKEVPTEGSEDFWEDGTRYPSEAAPYEYYMGYAHTVDWVRVTVDVKQAGKYNVSSNWACANTPCGLSIWFNDGSGKVDNQARPLDGANKSGNIEFEGTNDYHKWRKYPNFAQVDLSAGVQLMTFHVEVKDHLQYGFLQFDLVGGGGAGTGGSSAGGAAGSGAGGTGGADGTGGAPSGTAGTTTSTSAGAAGTTSSMTGGTPTTTAGSGSGGSSSTGNGLGSDTETNQDSSCTLAPLGNAGRASSGAGLLLVGALLLRRRRASV